MKHQDIEKKKLRNITHVEFYAYRLAIRKNWSLIHRSRKLFLQYILDSYITVEGNRLEYAKTHQDELRAENYKELEKVIASRKQTSEATTSESTTNDEARAGHRVVLPSTFIGGDRWFKQQYNDSMAICLQEGPPDLFITMTSNPQWAEIQEAVQRENCDVNFRPDIESRVFNLKCNELIRMIKEDQIFGVVVALLHVIEFQKRFVIILAYSAF